MIEPTDTESKESLDALVAALPSPPVHLSIASLGVDMAVSPQGLAADDSSSGWPLTVTLMSLVAASGAAALVVRRRSASANV